MAAAAVKLRLEEPSRILFAHSPLGAFVFTLIALGFTWGCWRFVPAEDGIVRWIFVVFCLLFVVAGVFGIFWRYELDIDLGRRRISIRRGFWPPPQTSDHGLDGLAHDGLPFLGIEGQAEGALVVRESEVSW